MTATRRWSERMLLVVNLAAGNAVAALWIAAFLQPSVLGVETRVRADQAVESSRDLLIPLQTPYAWLAFLCSVGLLLWNFSWVVRRRSREAVHNWVVSESASGPVRIAREAIESGLRAAGEALPTITRLRVQVLLSSSKNIQITGQFYCADGQDHLASSQRLRQALLVRFAELVRLSDASRADLELEFQGFFGKFDKNAPAPAEPEEDDFVPFRGPQYPIDDESVGQGSKV